MSEKGTEAATEQRKEKAKKKGDVVHSRELLSAVSMLAGVLVLGSCAKQFLSGWDQVYASSLQLGMGDFSAESLDRAVVKILAPALLPVGLILAASFAAALMAGVGQTGGVNINGEALMIKPERLSPVTNLGNIFSMRSMTRLAKSLLPAAVVIAMGLKAMRELVLPMPVMSATRLPETLSTCFDLAVKAAWVMVIWSALDYAMERVAWNKKLRMTKQELRDEAKETMGNPQVKGRQRRIQNAMRRRKVKADVSRASVVITNPTHFAVALEFSFESMLAPTVLVKGQNLHALKIREEARWAGVPIVENPPLARSLYKNVEEGQAIPYELYSAVAGILAFLYRQQVEKAARERRAADNSAKSRATKQQTATKSQTASKQTASTDRKSSTTEESFGGGGM
jgi:flagellar biosynthetic protein FlhB